MKTPPKSRKTREGSSLRRMVGRLLVRRCDYVNCCGDVNGCNGIYCDKERWERMTRDEYREHYRKEPPNITMIALSHKGVEE